MGVATSFGKTFLYQLNSFIMNSILGLGKYLFAVPFAVFGILHFMAADAMAPMAFGSSILVYAVGICLIAATVSILIGKYDKLATALLGLMLILFVILIHIKGASASGDWSSVLKDLALAGASWLYAGNLSKDNSVIG